MQNSGIFIFNYIYEAENFNTYVHEVIEEIKSREIKNKNNKVKLIFSYFSHEFR